MNPKQKATELFDKMCQTINDDCEHSSYCEKKECKWKGFVFCRTVQQEAKQCALIGVEQILKLSGLPQYQIIFWQEVKTEIEKL